MDVAGAKDITLRPIARIRTDFASKFGIPRQSGLVPELTGRIVFAPEFRDAAMLRGIEGFSHLWLIWLFSANLREKWSPTVRPPALGGNSRVGVLATRSPFRPNPLGLSCVELAGVEKTPRDGWTLVVRGADLMDGTPLLDIKPYIAYADSKPEAVDGFLRAVERRKLTVDFPPSLLAKVPPSERAALTAVLAHDPRPSYHDDPARVYGMPFGGWDVKFKVQDDVLSVVAMEVRQ